MARPGAGAWFEQPGVTVYNRGRRKAGLFLAAGGTITSAVPIALEAMPQHDADESSGRFSPVLTSGAAVASA
jgi:hypothetical protein